MRVGKWLVNPKPSFSVVVRTYGRPMFLPICLRSLESQTEPPREIIIVRASAADGMPKVSDGLKLIITQPKRRGVSRALNEGIARSSGDVVAFIDDDASASPDWIEALTNRYLAEPSIAGVGGLVIDQRTNEVWFDRGLIDVFGHAYMRPDKASPAYFAFPYLAGCNMSFRRKVLEEFGGFDEFYVYSHEEPDMCVRIQKAGLRIAFEPKAVVWHSYAPGPTRRNATYNSEKSRMYFALSNSDLPFGELVADTLLRLARESLDVGFRVTRGRAGVGVTISRVVEIACGTLIGFIFGTRARVQRKWRTRWHESVAKEQ